MRKASAAVLGCALLATVGALPAGATGPYPTAVRNCFGVVAQQTMSFANKVQAEVRGSILANMRGNTSTCAGPRVCVGGPKNTKACTGNASCGSAGGVAFECHPRSAGITAAIAAAEKSLRQSLTSACTVDHLHALFGVASGNGWCPDPSTPPDGLDPNELVDCILRTSLGELTLAGLAGTVGTLLGTGAPDAAVDAPLPKQICGVTLGGLGRIGAQAAFYAPATPMGTLNVSVPDGCTAGNPICNTKGDGIVGNMVAPPRQVVAGAIPICLTTRSLDAGNGTPEDGSIDLSTGQQTSVAPIATTVHLGIPCPICDRVTKVCTSPTNDSPHEGQPCTSPGRTDIACPPKVQPVAPMIVQRTELTTESVTLDVPVGAGVSNPVGAFCGACDGDPTIVCRRDQDCTAAGVCSAATGCCQFSTVKGAHGDATVQLLQASGRRGSFVPQLAGVGCVAPSGDPVVDGSVGLPGPLRTAESRLNAFRY